MSRFRRLRPLLFAVGLAALAFAAVRASRDLSGQVVPPPWAFASAIALGVLAHFCAARSWMSLFSGGQSRALAGGYYTSQLTKYLPLGGAVQAATQVEAARATGLSYKQVSFRFVLFMGSNLTAGALVGCLLLAVGDVALPVVIAVLLAGSLALASLHPVPLGWIEGRLARRLGSADDPVGIDRLRRSVAWSAGTLVAYSLAFSVLLNSIHPGSLLRFLAVAALAWTIGFLVLPVPAGLGIREAALVALLSPAPTGVILVASVAHRLTSIGAELIIAGGHHALTRAKGVSD